MRLKKLEIIGFKSFLDKTKVIFPPGISAVVGPNGCGKSNIVDALRWVMGEQSIKQLRGKAKEDIIFAGAAGRKQVNLAEVSLLVENTLGTASELLNDYSEIMITRRLYRSGESSYLINRQPCRLKDIHDLFLGSGTGKNSFAVIQQGNIGAITDANPEERRYFIEEAADITKYKTRKKETLSKVKSTKENLLRITDISAEIKRQINALNRQAKKATQYKACKKRIKYLEIKTALWEFNGYTAKIKELNDALQQKKAYQELGIKTLADLEADLANTRRVLFNKKNQIEELKTRQFEAQRAIDKYENDIEHYQKNRQVLDDELIENQKQRDELKLRNREVKEEIEQAENNNSDIGLKIQFAEKKIESDTKNYDAVKKTLAVFEANLKHLNSKHMHLAGENAKYKNILANAQKREEDSVRKLKISDEDSYNSQRKIEELKIKKNDFLSQKHAIDVLHNEIREDLKEISDSLGDKRRNHVTHLESLKLLEIENSRVTSRYHTLVNMHERYDWFEDGVKAVMESPFNDDNTIFSVLAEVVNPVAGYEKAVEAALGEALQSVIVDTFNTGVSLAKFLTETNKGRCVFIPRNMDVKPIETSKSESLPLLIDNVDYPVQYEAIVNYLLGNVVVAETFTDAVELKKNYKAVVTIVSKTGEVIADTGMITVGNRAGQVSILENKKELQTLTDDINVNTQKLLRAKDITATLENGIELFINKEKACREKLEDVEKEKNDSEKNIYLMEAELTEVERKLEIALLEQEQLSGEQYDSEDEIQESSKQLSEIATNIEKTDSEIEIITLNNKDVSEKLETLNKIIIDARLSITSLNAQSESYHSSLSRLKIFLKEGQERYLYLEDDIRTKIENNRNTGSLVKKITNELNDSYNFLKDVNKQVAFAQSEYMEIEMTLHGNEKLIRESNDTNEKILDNIRELQIRLSEFQIKRETITNRIEEKYHHRLNQYQLEFETDDHLNQKISDFEITGIETELSDLKRKIRKFGDVNLGAISEFEELKIRYDFMLKQHEDLTASLEDLEKIIDKINAVSQERFLKTFHAVNEKLSELFALLFEGGTAAMVLTEPSKPLETGVELMIKPPGKTLTRLSLLSGGEKALSAIAFVFSVFLIKPASFCIMDEIDAPLDDSNVVRFNNLVKVIGEQSQILIITHNKLTMEFADILFGVTMEKKGVSKIVSVNLTKSGDIDSTSSDVA